MVCKPFNRIFAYQDNFLFNDSAFFRTEGKWEEICSAWSHWSNTEQIIQTVSQGAATCQIFGFVPLGQVLSKKEKNKLGCTEMLSIFDQKWDECNKVRVTTEMQPIQTKVTVDFVTKKFTVIEIVNELPPNRVLLNGKTIGKNLLYESNCTEGF